MSDKSGSKGKSKRRAQTRVSKSKLKPQINQELENKLKQIFMDEFDIPEHEVTPNARLIDDLNADSLDMVELTIRVEQEFGIEIPDEDAMTLQTVRDYYNYLEEHLKQNQQ